MSKLVGFMGDLFSFEVLFLLFMFAGSFKSSPDLAGLQERADITVVMVGAGLVVAFFLLQARGVQLRPEAKLYLFLYAGLLLCATVSYLLMVENDLEATLKMKKLLVMNTWALLCPLFVINSERRIDRLLRLMLLFAVITGLDSLIRSSLMPGESRVLTYGGSVYHHLGRITGAGVVIVLARVASGNRSVGHPWHVLVGALLLTPLMLSGTRQALVGILVAASYLIFAISGRGSRSLWAMRLLAIILLIVGLGYAWRTLAFSDVNLEWGSGRMRTLWPEDADILRIEPRRPKIWATGLRLWYDHPVFGVGFGGFRAASGISARQPHNLFIEFLCELGLTGFIVICGLLWIPLRSALRQASPSDSPLILPAGALFVYALACAMVSGDVTDNRLIFTYAGLVISCEAMRREKECLLSHGPRVVGPRPGGECRVPP